MSDKEKRDEQDVKDGRQLVKEMDGDTADTQEGGNPPQPVEPPPTEPGIIPEGKDGGKG